MAFENGAAELLAWVEQAASASIPGTEVRPRHRRWAAARLAVRAMARSLLRERSVRRPRAARLFAAADAQASDPRQRALAALEESLGEPTAEVLPGRITADALGSLYPSLLLPGCRKDSGTFYTRSGLARPTVERTLGPLITGRSDDQLLALRICDPAMGSGHFLLEALRFLSAHHPDLAPRFAARCLFGVDLDPTAAALAALALWLEPTAARPSFATLERNLRVGDGLRQDLQRGTFDAVVGNPPWETLQPNSKEFFGELDPEYPRLGKQAALQRQRQVFDRDPAAESDWLAETARHREFTRWVREGNAYRHQGRGKLFMYRLFTEQSFHLLRDGGRLGLILPSGLYVDEQAAPLRRLLLDECRWEWLFSFENRRGIFAIDSRYRFGPVIAEKGGRTSAVRTAFVRHDLREWQAEHPPSFRYSRRNVARFSPRSLAFLEIRDRRDLAILERMHRHGQPFLDRDMSFAQGDFNMTSDSGRFVPRTDLEARGWRPCTDGRWRHERAEPGYLPLYQGAMVYDLHPNVAVHAGGAGHRTSWRPNPEPDRLVPQFLVPEAEHPVDASRAKLVLRALSNATNERTVVPALISDFPCGNSLVILTPTDQAGDGLLESAFGAGVLGSLVYDWAMRQRLAGTNLNRFILAETVWPVVAAAQKSEIARMAARLCLVSPWDRTLWRELERRPWAQGARPVRDPATRARLRIRLDVQVARAFGLAESDLRWILRDCALATRDLRDRELARALDPKGFWRVDADKPARSRYTARVLSELTQR